MNTSWRASSLEEAIALPAQASEPATLVYTLQCLANIYRAQGDLESCDGAVAADRRDFATASTAAPALLPPDGDRPCSSAARRNRAVVAHLRGVRGDQPARAACRWPGAVAACARRSAVWARPTTPRRCRACRRRPASLRSSATCQGEVEMLACVAVLHERSDSARRWPFRAWEEVRRLRVSLGDARGELEALEGIVRMQRRSGAPRDEVIPHLEAGLALAAKLADKRREASLRNTLGILEWEVRTVRRGAASL